MMFLPVSYDEIVNPAEEGLYVYDSAEDAYILTEDETVNRNTVYYIMVEDEDEEEEEEEPYYEADLSEITNPYEEGLYEYSEDDGYFPTEDTEVDPEKLYYYYEGDELDEEYSDQVYYPLDLEEGDNPEELGLYVLVDGLYIPTTDTEVVEGTVYYDINDVDYDDAEYYPVDLEPDDNPSELGLYQLVDDEYVLSAHTTPASGVVYYSYGTDEYAEDEEIINVPTTPIVSYTSPAIADSNGEYVEAFTSFYPDPYLSGFYEYVDGEYVLTNDREAVPRKAYYRYVELSDYRKVDIPEGVTPDEGGYFEYTQDGYVITTDTAAVQGKQYYVYDPVFPEYEEFEDPADDDNHIDPDYGVPIPNEIEE